ncbi:hypothetical protein D9M68_261640 [compost metagenome]
MGLHQRRGLASVPRRLFALLGGSRGAHRLGRRRARLHRGSASADARRQPLQDSHVPHFHRQEPRLWRFCANLLGLGGARPQAHEPHPRGQREAGLLRGGTRSQLLRYVPPPAGKQHQAVDRCARPWLGQHARQRHRSRRRLYLLAVPQPLRRPLRHGGGAGRRHANAYRYGRDARLGYLANVQDRFRPLGRRHLQSVQFRCGNQDGLLADARTGSVPQGCGAPAALQGHDSPSRYHDPPGKHQGVHRLPGHQ